MKTKTHWRKILFAFLTCSTIILLPHKIFAQSTCSTATFISDTTCSNNFVSSDSAVWYAFVASRTSGEIQLKNDSIPPAAYTSMELFSGVCSTGLTQLDSSRQETFGLVIDYSGLTISQTYFLRLSKSGNQNASYTFCIISEALSNCSSCNNAGCQVVCNYSFEGRSADPNTVSQITNSNCWNNVTGQNGTPDYFTATASSSSGVSIPNNFVGTQSAHTGTAYAGAYCYRDFAVNNTVEYREYIVGQFANPLIAGQYQVSFWVSLADNSGYAVKNLGAFISTAIPSQFNYTHLSAIPQVMDPSFISTDNGWVQITGVFTASGGEKYITLGEFSGDSPTLHIPHTPATNSFISHYAYYYIDDVTVDFIPPTISITQQPDTACQNFPITLSASSSPMASSYAWGSSNGGLTCLNPTVCSQESFSNAFSTPTHFVITGTFFPGCTTSTTYTVTPSQSNIIANAGSNQIICLGSSATLTGTANSSATNFTWAILNGATIASGTTNPFTATVSPTVTTQYVFNAYDSNTGCSSKDTVTISVDSPAPLITNSNSATGCDTSAQYHISNYSPSNIYVWNVTDVSHNAITFSQPSANLVIVNWQQQTGGAGGYVIVTETDKLGCIGKDTLFVQGCCRPSPAADTLLYNDTASVVFGNNPPTIFFTHFDVNGTFVVNTNMTFVLCDFNMAPNAKIIVTGGHTLHLETDTVRAGCCQMWDAIEGESLSDSIIIEKFSYVGDGIRGIVSNNGSPFKIFNHVTMNRNYISITVNPYNGNHGGYVSQATFESEPATYCSSYSAGTLLPPYSGQWPEYGIYVNGVNKIQIGDPSALTFRNNFTHLRHGIRTHLTNTNIYNNLFVNVAKAGSNSKAIWSAGRFPTIFPFNLTQYDDTIGGTTAGLFQKNVFIDCPFGVYLDTAMGTLLTGNTFRQTYLPMQVLLRGTAIHENMCNGFLRNVFVFRDSIIDHRYGISCYNDNQCHTIVNNNTIIRNQQGSFTCTGIYMASVNGNVLGATAIRGNTIRNVENGVFILNIPNVEVDNNFIDLRPTPTSALQVHGVYVANSRTPRITNNLINRENHLGVPITSNWVGGIYVTNCSKSHVTCNGLTKIGYGILFDGQGSPSDTVFNNFMSNTFTGIWLRNGAVIGQQGGQPNLAEDNTWSGAVTNRLFTSNSTFGNFSPFIYRPNVAAAFPSPTSSFNGGLPITIVATTNTNPPHTGCPVIFPLPGGGGGGVLLRQLAQAQIQFSTNQDASIWLSREGVQRVLQYDSTLATGDSVLTNFKDSVAQSNLGKFTTLWNMYSQSSGNPAVAASAYTVAGSILPANIIEQRLKTVTRIMFAQQMNGGVLSQTQVSTLRTIAQLCPFTDGNAVYMARAILAPIDTSDYVSSCETDEQNNGRVMNPAAQQDSSDAFKLYPNPNNGQLTLSYNVNENEGGQMYVYSTTGKLVKTVYLVSGQQQMEIDLSDLDAGLYIYLIRVNGELRHSNRIVIIK